MHIFHVRQICPLEGFMASAQRLKIPARPRPPPCPPAPPQEYQNPQQCRSLGDTEKISRTFNHVTTQNYQAWVDQQTEIPARTQGMQTTPAFRLQ